MSRVDFGELVSGLSETVGYRRAREVVEEAVAACGLGEADDYAVDEAIRVCEHVVETHPSPLSLAARTLRDRLRVRRLDRSATDAPSLFENAVDPAVEVGFTGGAAVVRRMNDRFADTFGLDPDAVTGRSLRELPVPPTDDDTWQTLMGRLRAADTLDLEVTGRQPAAADDEERVYRLRGIGAVRGEEVTSAYLVYTDITERRRRRQELERRNEHLEAFASIVSHDLRNPLGIAKGYLDIAREETEVPHGESIEDALDRMSEIIDEMLVLARGSQTIEDPEGVDLERVALEAWRHVPTGDAALELGDLGRIRSDHTRLLHVLENCYRNSVEHGTAGGLPDGGASAVEESGGRDERSVASADDGDGNGADTDTSVTVRVWLEGDRLHVADDGSGMAPERRQQALEAGYSSDRGGTGLGLFIVKEIAEAHSWDIELGESDGGGLQVTFHGVERME
jgi:PAS domain S-box-containing protein